MAKAKESRSLFVLTSLELETDPGVDSLLEQITEDVHTVLKDNFFSGETEQSAKDDYAEDFDEECEVDSTVTMFKVTITVEPCVDYRVQKKVTFTKVGK